MQEYNFSAEQPRCLVMSSQPTDLSGISDWLIQSALVACVDVVHTETELKQQLRETAYHLCIIVVGNNDQVLPSNLLRYPDLRVLILTQKRKTGPLTPWLEQGASDVVSLKKTELAQHALRRLLCECLLQMDNEHLCNQNRQLHQQIAKLQSQSLISQAMQATPEILLPAVNQNNLAETKKPVAETPLKEPDLPSRQAILQRFEAMLKSSTHSHRYTVMLVKLRQNTGSQHEQSLEELSQQHLSLYRAASALKSKVSDDSLMGQANDSSLLVIQPASDRHTSRYAANRVRRALAGLFTSPDELKIDTLNLSACTLSAMEVIERLEARQH